MARKPSTRVVLNRSKFSEALLATADGLAELCKVVLDVAEPPDATPFGEGLVTSGGYLVYVGDKKVAGGGQDGKQPKKPRAFRVKGSTQLAAIVGYGFPGRFQELGVIHHPAQPFLTPAVDATSAKAVEIMKPIVAPKLRNL